MVTRTEEILRRELMEITLSKAIELFVATKRTEGCTEKTVGWYEYLLGHYAEYLGENGKSPKVSGMTVNDARAFVASLQSRDTLYQEHPRHPEVQRGLSPYTIHAYVRVLKVFGNWLVEDNLSKQNAFARLKKPRLPQPMIEILSDQEIDAILSAISPNCFLGARMYTVVLFLLDTGIRASELTSLTLQNTDIDDSRLKVCGKGRKERMVFFSVNTRKALLRYVHTWRQPAYGGIDNVILSTKANR